MEITIALTEWFKFCSKLSTLSQTLLTVYSITIIFFHSFSYPLSSGLGSGGSSPRRTRNNSRFSTTFYRFTGSTPSQTAVVITPPGPWPTSAGTLSRSCSQQDSPRQSFLDHSGHIAEPSPLICSEKWLDIQGFTNFTAVQFVAKHHATDFSQKSHFCRLYLR